MKDPEVFLKMILDEGKSKDFLDPKISLVKLCDEELSFKWYDWCLANRQENISLVFKVGGGLEDRMFFDFFC